MFTNRKLNDCNLMSAALKLLPKNKNHCYPTKQTDLDYFKQITKWFKSTITLRNEDMYCYFNQRPPIMMSLALQMKFKAAISLRDYVLIFIILLRAIGIQCRMVQSIVLAPLMPPKSELFTVSAKKTETKGKLVNNRKNSNSKKGKKPSGKNITIPQLDGGDDKAAKKKVRKTITTGETVADNKDETPKGSKQAKSKDSLTKMAPKIRFSMDSPNRFVKSPSEKLFKNSSKYKQLTRDNTDIFSPRKTRAMRKEENSSTVAAEKETLQVFSPRRLRSRSRSNDEGAVPSKPNLKNLSSTSKVKKRSAITIMSSETKPKKFKTLSQSNSRKRHNNESKVETIQKKTKTNEENENLKKKTKDRQKILESNIDEDAEETSDASKAKSFKKKATASTNIDRRVLSTDSEADNVQVKSKGIDIWAELWSEKVLTQFHRLVG